MPHYFHTREDFFSTGFIDLTISDATLNGMRSQTLGMTPERASSLDDHGQPSVSGGAVDDCPICISAFSVGERCVRLKTCGHCFHYECLELWTREQATCPNCRAELWDVDKPRPLSLQSAYYDFYDDDDDEPIEDELAEMNTPDIDLELLGDMIAIEPGILIRLREWAYELSQNLLALQIRRVGLQSLRFPQLPSREIRDRQIREFERLLSRQRLLLLGGVEARNELTECLDHPELFQFYFERLEPTSFLELTPFGYGATAAEMLKNLYDDVDECERVLKEASMEKREEDLHEGLEQTGIILSKRILEPIFKYEKLRAQLGRTLEPVEERLLFYAKLLEHFRTENRQWTSLVRCCHTPTHDWMDKVEELEERVRRGLRTDFDVHKMYRTRFKKYDGL